MQRQMAADAADRERQARALAAAGMQAEQINVGGLQPPPVLGNPGAVLSSSSAVAGAAGVQPGPGVWNNLDGGGDGGGDIMEADEMELDFAAMFDPAQEAQGEFLLLLLVERNTVLLVPRTLRSNCPQALVSPPVFVYPRRNANRGEWVADDRRGDAAARPGPASEVLGRELKAGLVD